MQPTTSSPPMLSTLLQLPRIKSHVLADNEKRIIKPYFALAEQKDLLQLMLDPSMLNGIEEQIKIKSCITSQVIFLIQAYLLLLVLTPSHLNSDFHKYHQQKAQELKQPHEEIFTDLKVGIVGCGVIGKSILNALVFILGWVPASNIHVSTRRPENLQKYEEIGFNIYFDNAKLVEQCDVIIWSFPPSLDNWAAVELKNALKNRVYNTTKFLKPLVISVVSNLYIPKLEKLLVAEHIYSRSHVNKKQLSQPDEDSFGGSLFSDSQLIGELLLTFQTIFKDSNSIATNTGNSHNTIAKASDVTTFDKSVRQAIVGSMTTTFNDMSDLTASASYNYIQQMSAFQSILTSILSTSASSTVASE